MIDAISRDDILELKFELGPKLVATLAASRDRHVVDKWLDGTVVPTQQEAHRLAFALEQFRRVASSEGADTTRNWFTSTCIPGGLSPFMAIRVDDFDTVLVSAQRLIDGTDGW